MSTRARDKVQCDCKACNGKLVDARTRNKHAELERNLASRISGFIPSLYRSRDSSYNVEAANIGYNTVAKESSKRIRIAEQESRLPEDDNYYEPTSADFDQHFPLKKRRRQDSFQKVKAVLDDFSPIGPIYEDEEGDDVNNGDDEEEGDDDVNNGEEEEEDDDDYDDEEKDDDDDEEEDNDGDEEDDYNDEEDDYDDEDDDDNEEEDDDVEQFDVSNTTFDYGESWIILWILKYQSRFRLPDVAINALIKFFHQVLQDANYTKYKEFPSSLHIAKKLLKISKWLNYAVCKSCHTLYDVTEVITEDDFKCRHIEFPNHPMRTKREPCGAELTKQVPVVKGYIKRPKLLFPLPDLKTQIVSLYQRPDFEEQITKWTNRHANSGIMTDVYDGEIWKNFPSQMDNLESRFFTTETAGSNLGIMINLDWFQPFDSTPYSCGAIYGVICNLPRNVRFNKENMLTLGLLPGPSEVKLDKINNYLTPIINELLDFWNGVKLPTKKCPNGKKIRLAVICCSSDIPAARKLCGHISASVGCHRCYKTATSKEEGQRPNFGGFDDMENWFTTRDVEEHKRNAAIWKQQNTEEDRRRHVSETHVRWSEMLRLPYHDPIRHLVVDPMHNLFLGIAKCIIKKLWIGGNKISKADLEMMEKRAKNIKIPADLGRIPYKIATGEGFSSFTADQWKTFILVYAIPIMWDLLSVPDRKILGNFVRACSLLVCRIIDNNMITEAHERLLKVAMLIEENYGPEQITPNLHLCLHIKECCQDYGPLYSFWCFSFERMNGVLGKLYVNCCKQ